MLSEKSKLILRYKANPELAVVDFLMKGKEEMKQIAKDGITEAEEKLRETVIKTVLSDEKFLPTLVALVIDELGAIKEGKQGEQGTAGKDGDTPRKGKDYLTPQEINQTTEYIKSKIRFPKDGVDGIGKDGTDGRHGTDGRDGYTPKPSKDYPTIRDVDRMIRAEITALPREKVTDKEISEITNRVQSEIDFPKIAPAIARAIEGLGGKNKLDYFALKNLPDIPKGEQQRTLHRGGGGLSVFAYDLSSLCDGSNKTFTVPAHTRAIMLSGTDAPLTYRPTTDFITSGVTLTLTSAVFAPSLGSTLIFIYAK